MSDDKPSDQAPRVIVPPPPIEPIAAPSPKVTVRSVRIIPTEARSPGNNPIDIVEVELAIPNDGNFAWFRYMDALRFQVERGQADAALKALGLK